MNAHNLKPCKPGETHNSGGGSKKAHLRHIFKESITDLDRKEVYEVAKRLAKRGVPFFVELFLDRDEGKVPNKTEMSGKDGEPMKFDVTVTTPEAVARLDELRKKLAGE